MVQPRRRTTASWLLAPALALALPFAAAACGGGGGTLSKADFQKKADGICKTASDASQKKLDKLFPQDSKTAPTSSQLRQALSIAVDSFRDQASKIDALHEPSSVSADASAMVKDLRDATNRIEKDGTKALDDNAPDYFAKATKDAKDLGLKECGQD